jgi:hypothetical protein
VGDFALLRCDLAGREPLLDFNAIENPKPGIQGNGRRQCNVSKCFGDRATLRGSSCNVICRHRRIVNSAGGSSCNVICRHRRIVNSAGGSSCNVIRRHRRIVNSAGGSSCNVIQG